MTTQTRVITYEEYLKEPESMERREIVDGVEIMAASPIPEHQGASIRISTPLHIFVSQNELGQVWYAPLDVVVQQNPTRVRQPDLMFVSNERASMVGSRIEGGPDLVVEILSPSNTRSHIEEKLADYATVNVLECWLVSLEARTVEVLRQEVGQWRRAYIRGAGDVLESAVLPGLDLDIASIFAGI